MSCPLRKCQGKRGCICPSKPPPFIYSKTTEKSPTVQEEIPIVSHQHKRPPPKYIGENAPRASSPGRIPNKPKKISPVKAITAKIPRSDTSSNSPAQKQENGEGNGNDLNKVEARGEEENKSCDDEFKNGNVQINYNHYKKQFPLINGSLTCDVIDNEYCLSFAFPKCKLHLSTYSPNDFSFEDMGLSSPPLQEENPVGTFQNMRTDTIYWVHLEEDAKELEAYNMRQDKYAEEAAVKRKEAEEKEAIGLVQSIRSESCSCIEGNPCMDRYGCKNWDKRYEIAKQNGWKGF